MIASERSAEEAIDHVEPIALPAGAGQQGGALLVPVADRDFVPGSVAE